nr:MAG TPA: hypothetical protein [Caudoviricetes sp.]
MLVPVSNQLQCDIFYKFTHITVHTYLFPFTL